jgi:hypothetical protein
MTSHSNGTIFQGITGAAQDHCMHDIDTCSPSVSGRTYRTYEWLMWRSISRRARVETRFQRRDQSWAHHKNVSHVRICPFCAVWSRTYYIRRALGNTTGNPVLLPWPHKTPAAPFALFPPPKISHEFDLNQCGSGVGKLIRCNRADHDCAF